MTTRRQFLAACSALTLTAGISPATLFTEESHRGQLSLNQINFGTFASLVGSTFKIPGESARLKLVEAKLTPSNYPGAHLAPDAQNEKFSLMFRGAIEGALPQKTHVFEHPEIGEFAMFIVPVKTGDAAHAYYQAIFNRQKKLT